MSTNASSNNIHLDVTDKVKEKLVDLGYDPKMGHARRTIQSYEDAITDFTLKISERPQGSHDKQWQ